MTVSGALSKERCEAKTVYKNCSFSSSDVIAH